MILHSEWRDTPADCHRCGDRCDYCTDRMCSAFGPEPDPTCEAHRVCRDCAVDHRCSDCSIVRIGAAWEHADKHGDPTSPAAYAWPDDSAAGLIREDREWETGARVARYAEKRDSE